MKNWKFIKIGNEATGPNWDKKRQLEDELRGWMTTASKATGEEKQNAEKQIADIRKELNDVKIKIAHGENKKAGNETLAEYAKSKPRIINGLIRARNAIKTKNADITLWNGNDSAYIKEDGHVQYLENNSFVVDEDKYDSQEKAVEEWPKHKINYLFLST